MLEYWLTTRTQCWSTGGICGQDVGVLVDYTDKMLNYWWTTQTRCWSIGGLLRQDDGVLVDYTDTMLEYWWHRISTARMEMADSPLVFSLIEPN